MRILILGASGLAGAEIRRTLDTPGNLVYGSCRNPAGAAGLCRYDLDGPGDLEAVLEEVRRSFRENLTAERMRERMNALCALEHSVPLRLVPLPLKDVILRIATRSPPRV